MYIIISKSQVHGEVGKKQNNERRVGIARSGSCKGVNERGHLCKGSCGGSWKIFGKRVFLREGRSNAKALR